MYDVRELRWFSSRAGTHKTEHIEGGYLKPIAEHDGNVDQVICAKVPHEFYEEANAPLEVGLLSQLAMT